MNQSPGLDNLFRDLSAEELSELATHIEIERHEAGTIFHLPNEAGEQAFFLLEGRVRIYKLSPEGRALTLLIINPPNLFGEMALIGQGRHDTCAEAMTDCVVGVINRDDLRRFLSRYPAAAIELMELMAARLRVMEQRLADIAFKSVPQRLAALLLDLAGDSADGGAPTTLVRYTHQQLAEMIGAYRETVTKALGEMREANLIRVAGDEIILVDPVQLRRMAS